MRTFCTSANLDTLKSELIKVLLINLMSQNVCYLTLGRDTVVKLRWCCRTYLNWLPIISPHDILQNLLVQCVDAWNAGDTCRQYGGWNQQVSLHDIVIGGDNNSSCEVVDKRTSLYSHHCQCEQQIKIRILLGLAYRRDPTSSPSLCRESTKTPRPPVTWADPETKPCHTIASFVHPCKTDAVVYTNL